MFVSYNTTEFGNKLKDLRKQLGISQAEVCQYVNINQDTLRRIENGYVIPKFETLELLSKCFQHNLLLLLDQNKSSNILLLLYEKIDYLIANNDSQVLQSLRDTIDTELSLNLDLIDQIEFQQFKYFIDALGYNYAASDMSEPERTKTYSQALDKIDAAIKLRIADFFTKTVSESKLTFFEVRLLILRASVLEQIGNIEESTELFSHLISRMNFTNSTSYHKQLIVKIYCNLSYNYHRLDEHSKALETAQSGIDYCIANDLMYWLYYLYCRKAIAMFRLREQGYEEFFKYGITLLKMQGREDLAEQYIKITYEKYGIHI